MSNKKYSYSFFNLLTIIVGTMVGVGIFFKNAGILAKTNNIWIALVTWVVGSLVVMGLVLGFAETSSATKITGEEGTLSKWMEMFVSRKAAKLTAVFLMFLWYPTMVLTLAFFSAHFTFLAVFGATKGYWGLVTIGGSELSTFAAYFVVSTFYMAVMSWFNAVSYKFGKDFQAFGTFVKFIPLLLVIVLGFIAPVVAGPEFITAKISGGATGAFSGMINGKPQTWVWTSIILALPGVLFAFDAFLGGLNLQREEEKQGDAINATICGVIATTIFYLLFAGAVGYGTSNGDILDIMSTSFGKMGGRAIFAFITISALAVVNGMIVPGQRFLKQVSDDKLFVKIKLLEGREKTGELPGQAKFLFWSSFVMFTILMLLSLSSKSSFLDYIDVWSNVATLGGYLIYALIILGTVANRWSKRVKVEEKDYLFKGAIPAVVFTLLLVPFIVIKELFPAKGMTELSFFILFGIIIVGLLYAFDVWTTNKEKYNKKY